MSARAPLLVFAIGNPSRGDDALGPALANAWRERGGADDTDVELLDAYQLQIEDSLQLAGRAAVLFIDASRRSVPGGVQLLRLEPRSGGAPAFTHALEPAALLALAGRVLDEPPPPAWLMAVEGENFDLGAALSAPAAQRLARARELLEHWLSEAPCRTARSTELQGCAVR